MKNLPAIKHFLKNSTLSAKNKDLARPHLVMLEGVAGAGKHDILSRLSKIGYLVCALPYGEVSKKYPFLPPRNPLVSAAWSTRFLDEALRLSSPSSTVVNSQSSPLRENTVFFSRSLLSPYIHNPTASAELLETMKDLKSKWNVTLIWCDVDPHIFKQRVQGRHVLNDDEKKEFQKNIGELDETLQDQYAERYKSLAEREDIFDAVIPTTSTKQAVANILGLLDFQWASPKWDQIRKIAESDSHPST